MNSTPARLCIAVYEGSPESKDRLGKAIAQVNEFIISRLTGLSSLLVTSQVNDTLILSVFDFI
jgi:hypothetical protein